MQKKFVTLIKQEYAWWIILGFSLGIFITLSIALLNRSSIWFDEAFSAYISQYNFIEIIKYTAYDVHPPLYYWILNLWNGIFGLNESSLRLMSVFFGSTALISCFLLVRKMFGANVGAYSALLLSFSPMLLRYSTEARMYTMAATLIFVGTLIMIYANERKSKKLWTAYGIIVGLGMWTHYFTALIWLSLFVWNLIYSTKPSRSIRQYLKNIFSYQWFKAYLIAAIVFVLWIPVMLLQLTVIQATGFWIGPVGVNSFTNFVTNSIYYLQFDQVINWQAFAIIAIIIFVALASRIVYKTLDVKEKSYYVLLALMSFFSPVLLFVASMPPLKPSFVERYLIPASMSLILLISVTILIYVRRKNEFLGFVILFLVSLTLCIGASNVFYYGNYNKNSQTSIETRTLVKKINQEPGGTLPIIASSPWIYYEAYLYASPKNPIYFVDSDTKYEFGSLQMLKETNKGKIINIDEFLNNNPTFWYIGFNRDSELKAPYPNVSEISRIKIKNNIDNKEDYQAVLYQYKR